MVLSDIHVPLAGLSLQKKKDLKRGLSDVSELEKLDAHLMFQQFVRFFFIIYESDKDASRLLSQLSAHSCYMYTYICIYICIL